MTTSEILDSVQAQIVDQSAKMRLRLLSILNLAFQYVLNEPRTWEFQKTVATVAIASSVVTLPTDYLDFNYITFDGNYYDQHNILTDSEAFTYGTNGGEPTGIVIDSRLGTLTIVPATTATTAQLCYKAGLPSGGYADNDTTTTIFPIEFKPLFVRSLLTARNEFDEEDQYGTSIQLDAILLKQMKVLDSNRKAKRAISPHGYTRVSK